jgi:hypothetical protein
MRLVQPAPGNEIVSESKKIMNKFTCGRRGLIIELHPGRVTILQVNSYCSALAAFVRIGNGALSFSLSRFHSALKPKLCFTICVE